MAMDVKFRSKCVGKKAGTSVNQVPAFSPEIGELWL